MGFVLVSACSVGSRTEHGVTGSCLFGLSRDDLEQMGVRCAGRSEVCREE